MGYIGNLANGYAWVLFLEQSHVHGELSQPYLINKQKFPRTKDGSRAPATDIPNSILGHFYLLVPIEGYLAGIPIPTANFEVLEVPLIYFFTFTYWSWLGLRGRRSNHPQPVRA